MTIRFSALSAVDLVAWSGLTNLLAQADETDEFYDAEDLAEELEEPGFDPGRDSIAVWDGEELVGFGQLRVADVLFEGQAKATIDGGVHPDHRGRGIGRRIMDGLEARARELAAQRHPGAPVSVGLATGAEGSSSGRMAVSRGYAPVRYFTDMMIELPRRRGDTVEAPPSTEGPLIEVYTAEMEEAVRRAHNDAFADHWGAVPKTRERWADQQSARSFRASLSPVVRTRDIGLDPVESVDGYALCGQWAEGEIHVSLLGTRSRARHQGLASALLDWIVTEAERDGYRMVDLAVDSASPTGAGRVYERAGFTAVRTWTVHRRQLD
ncbi:MAG: GNAT family N-acetyltransferase [Arthrobacter sp.]|uniref:GNAT family N-acetyltransferase n=1 Tax=unclassified Arthrobacter TaxID=235627 RepID=UPI00264D423B|nr:GNAT family N-acetyltransferase [Micrococcaceae bacterium]MDN5878634.1 GNAT family N-acetyltransferase [Micrococcaceae bacterium]MDN6178928.1 GNAT family N-acetyltransferase [Micrococcaceae bacterium]